LWQFAAHEKVLPTVSAFLQFEHNLQNSIQE
jgi:hypothetical protein